MKPILKRWEAAFKYIEATPQITDVVVSGGDAYYLSPEQLAYIGERLIKIPNVKKFRIASKGLGVAPNRILDPNDQWSDALLWVHRLALKEGKRAALHTHINHPNEISWVTEQACRKLIEGGLTVRNQSVLLHGINDNADTISKLIRSLAEDLRINPVSTTHHHLRCLVAVTPISDQVLSYVLRRSRLWLTRGNPDL